MGNFCSPLATGNVRVIQLRKDQPPIIRNSNVLRELPNLYGRDARRKAIAEILAAQEMERDLNKIMRM